MPKGWGVGEDKVEGPLRGSSCSHPLDQFGIGYGESLNTFKVGLLSLKPLPGCNYIEEPVPLALSGLVKEVWQVEVEVMSVSK